MKKRAFIIHGWGGKPDANWFPWLKMELKKQDFHVNVPKMPNADFPVQSEWLVYMQDIINNVDNDIFLIGHSLGVVAILRFLESLPAGQRVGGVVLVSGFSESLGTIPEIENFFENRVDYEKIKLHCSNFIVINSDDDPYVPMEKGEILRDNLNAKLIVLHEAGHINMGTGYFQLPIALEELIKITNKTTPQ